MRIDGISAAPNIFLSFSLLTEAAHFLSTSQKELYIEKD